MALTTWNNTNEQKAYESAVRAMVLGVVTYEQFAQDDMNDGQLCWDLGSIAQEEYEQMLAEAVAQGKELVYSAHDLFIRFDDCYCRKDQIGMQYWLKHLVPIDIEMCHALYAAYKARVAGSSPHYWRPF